MKTKICFLKDIARPCCNVLVYFDCTVEFLGNSIRSGIVLCGFVARTMRCSKVHIIYYSSNQRHINIIYAVHALSDDIIVILSAAQTLFDKAMEI